METLGYFAALFIGVILGLIGAGGSILTLPVLVYLFQINPIVATASSLFIVGTTSVVGSLSYIKNKMVSFPTALLFGIPSIIAVFLTRLYLLPSLPAQLFSVGDFIITKEKFLMLVFAMLMIFAASSMINNKQHLSGNITQKGAKYYALIIVQGLSEGTLTGLVGAGGGFLIIPALVLFSNLPIKKAIGTSLIIISVKSLIGFSSEITNPNIDWPILLKVTAIAIIGILVGLQLNKRINNEKLKPMFGWFILLMGIYIFLKETILK